jgi:predicted CXXCH cytochrome family protein
LMRSRRKARTKRNTRNSLPRNADPVPSKPETFGLRLRSPQYLAIAVAFLVVTCMALFAAFDLMNFPNSTPKNAAPSFVGSDTCASCHQAEAELWRHSQHRLAMEHATDKSVLGDFSNTTFDYFGVTSRFFRRGGEFMVQTDGPDGTIGDFEIKYTFGVYPLQQYLVAFPDGRLQALPIAWDTRPKQAGGQRWFHLYPDRAVRSDNMLHWTKLNQNWNFMCAECHSTGVRKNYDSVHDQFKTTWAEISVGCEACHGQGSQHVAWARNRRSWWPFARFDDPMRGLLVRFDERHDVMWSLDKTTGQPRRNIAPAILRKEVETCGLCHARRTQFSEDWVPGHWLSDTHHISTLMRGLYYADGQMQDEVYNYGSFKQSKMFMAGVTCSDCHEPHSAKLRVSGDGLCTQCHSPANYATPAHSHHDSPGSHVSCASCHMPVRTYMIIDPRHDHSFRIPRPDLAATLKTPNTCNDCHNDKSAEWAASAITRWFGPKREGLQTYGEAFRAAWSQEPRSALLLAAVAANGNVPAIARASALSELGSEHSPVDKELVEAGLTDPDPMVRIGALDLLENGPAPERWSLAAPLLSDPVRGVRIRAASLLAAVPTANQPAVDREAFDRADAEFIAAQRFNADRPEARSALANFYASRGQLDKAETEYKAALKLNPQYAPAAINLADLYRALGNDAAGERLLRAMNSTAPENAEVHYTLGLVLVRLKRNDEALTEFQEAAKLAPDRARYAYVYGVALHSMGLTAQAMDVLDKNLALHPEDRNTLLALITFNRDLGDLSAALKYAQRLSEITPEDRGLKNLIQELRDRTARPQ